MYVIAAYLMCILIFAKIGRHVDGHLGFLRPHHDSSQSPSIFLHLRYVSNCLWNNFLWISHAHRHPLRDCIITETSYKSILKIVFYLITTLAGNLASGLNLSSMEARPRVYITFFSYSTQLSTKFILLIKLLTF